MHEQISEAAAFMAGTPWGLMEGVKSGTGIFGAMAAVLQDFAKGFIAWAKGTNITAWAKGTRARRRNLAIAIIRSERDSAVVPLPTDRDVSLLAASWCRPRRSRIAGPRKRSQARVAVRAGA